jgi:putative transferase (TIGR04331 family)
MKKYNLIIDYSKLNFKKKSHLIFFDEFLYNLFPKKELKNYSSLYINDFDYLSKRTSDFFFIKKKLKIYRKQLSNKLNEIHNTNYSIKFWGLILDYFLVVLINNININFKSINRIKKNYDFNAKLIDLKNIFFLDMHDFLKFLEDDYQYTAYIRSVIIKTITKNNNYKSEKITKNFSQEIRISYNLIYQFTLNFIIFFFRIYIFIAKPTIIFNGYFKIKNSLLIFLKSFGRIFFVNSQFFFYKKNFLIRKNNNLRENIKIKEIDYFDKVFNILLVDFLPSSYLEAHMFYNGKVNIFSNRILKIGSATSIIADDYFKYLTAAILEKKGLFFSFQHGGFLGQSKLRLPELIEKKYSSKIFYWNNKEGLGMHYLSNFKKIKIDKIPQNNLILLYQTNLVEHENYADGGSLNIKSHPYLNGLYQFYNGLDLIYKNISAVKLFPQYNVSFTKKIWIKKCGNEINFLQNNRGFDLFYKSRIVILDDISTALIELLYIGVPFILIHNNKFYDYDEKFIKYFNYLIKLNILFSSSKEASEFINKNYYNIGFWWTKVNEDKVFIKFKNEFFNKKKNYISKIIKAII